MFSSCKMYVDEIFVTLVQKNLTNHAQLALTCLFTTCTFVLWMFKGTHDVFNFLSSTWQFKHITIELFEATNTSGVITTCKLQQLLHKFSLTQNKLCIGLPQKDHTCKSMDICNFQLLYIFKKILLYQISHAS